MALNKIIQHNTGAYCNYWRVVQTNLDYNNKTGTIILFGYVSEEARNNDKINLDSRTFVLNSDNFDTYFMPSIINPQDINQVKNSYLYIKTTPEFSTSTDC